MFTAQTKEGPKNRVHLNVVEIERLLAFAKAHVGHGVSYVTVTGSETGIGMHIEASAKHDAIRFFKDISDYGSW